MCRCSAWIQGNHKKTGAVINGCVLVKSLCNLAGIHLNAITGDRALIAAVALFGSFPFEWRHMVLLQHLLDSCQSQM